MKGDRRSKQKAESRPHYIIFPTCDGSLEKKGCKHYGTGFATRGGSA